jgi:hypothetical protein
MIVLVSGARAEVSTAPLSVGVLLVPSAWDNLDRLQLDRRIWAIDNGAFSGLDYPAFERLLNEAMGRPECKFVAAPDVVGDAPATLRKFRVWGRMIRSLGFPVALVAQDGLTVADAPWDDFDALFVGGTTAWKMSRAAETLLAYAAATGKWRHVGRVNTRSRMQHFHGLCDSVDGSGFSKWPYKIGLAQRWMTEMEHRPQLKGIR